MSAACVEGGRKEQGCILRREALLKGGWTQLLLPVHSFAAILPFEQWGHACAVPLEAMATALFSL